MYDTDHDYQSRLDDLDRRQPSPPFPWRWGRGLSLLGAACAAWDAWFSPQERVVPLLLFAVVLVCVACRPRRRPAGEPIPPAQMRRLLGRGKAYAHGTHHVIVADGIYAYDPQTGYYERVEGAMDPLLAEHWIGEKRSARFRDSFERVSWLSYLWRH
jgi:hypothetical protein